MEAVFKAAFAVVFAMLLAAALGAARRLRGREGATVDQTGHELPLLRWLRPVLGVVFYAGLLDWLVPGTRIEPAVLPLPVAVRWAGAAIALSGTLLVWWSMATLGPQYRGGVGLWDDHRLVTGGPYRWIRHPTYLGFVVVMAGVGLLSASWLVGGSGLLLTAAIPALRAPVEEAELESRFGEGYRRYAARTGRYLPRIFRPARPDGVREEAPGRPPHSADDATSSPAPPPGSGPPTP